MSQILTRAILVMTLMFSLSWAGKAMAQSGAAETEVVMGELSFADVGTDYIESPCNGAGITLDGLIQYTFIIAFVDTPSGMEQVLELQQMHGSAAGMDDDNNAYMANLAASVQYECGTEYCELAHLTVRSRTAPNFELTLIIKANADGTLGVEKGQGTCQATGTVDTGL